MPNFSPAAVDVFNLYIDELCWNIAAAKSKCEELFSKFLFNDDAERIIVANQVHDLCFNVIVHADNIRKLLFNDASQRPGERTERAEWRKKRSEALQKLIGTTEYSELRDARLRNRFAHYDEYIDRLYLTVQSMSRKSEQKKLIIIHNMVFPTESYLRRLIRVDDVVVENIGTYFYSEKIYVHFGQRYNLGALAAEVEALEVTVMEKVGSERFKRHGRLLVFSEASFEPLRQ